MVTVVLISQNVPYLSCTQCYFLGSSGKILSHLSLPHPMFEVRPNNNDEFSNF